MRNILLTGATGFVGKVVLAELLRRSELSVDHVYLVIRPKRGKAPGDRFHDDIAGSRLFRDLPAGWTDRVTALAGDLAKPNAGLSAEDLALVTGQITQIVHCAASVEFDLPVAEAADANITSALNVMAIARACTRLQRMVAVSTAYVTPWRAGPLPEALVQLPFDPAETYADILAGRADEEALLRASGHPNTYTLTKSIAEHLVTAARGDVQLSIVRPSIISATLRHPFPGWIDSAAAFAGFVTLIGAGHMRALLVDPSAKLDIVPCDVVADHILDEAFGTGAPCIRHAVVGVENGMEIGPCCDVITHYFTEHPIDRKPDLRYRGTKGHSFTIKEWHLHTLPLAAGGLTARLTGQRKVAKLARKLSSKLRYVNRAFQYFTHHTFEFAGQREAALQGFNALRYAELVCVGVRRHIAKRDPAATPLAGRRHTERNDLGWALGQPNGNWAIRLFGYVLRKAARQATDLVSYDHDSFVRAVAGVPAGTQIALVPVHRSYADFLLCSYLFFARPELGVKIPHIAAAEEFSRIPVLGWLFTQTHAFYLRRGVKREDPELTRRVQELVSRQEVIQFFIEGGRSRTRQFLRPRTGLLRCFQSTGQPIALLPIAITYDRVPEESVLAYELSGEQRPRMSVRALLNWFGGLSKGKVALGRVHVVCAEPVVLHPNDDVREAANLVMRGLQSHTAVTTHHLRMFLHRAAPAGVDFAWLRATLEKRGVNVIDSELRNEDQVSPVTELALRQQWMPWFYEEALSRWPDHPVLRHEAAVRRWVPAPTPGTEAADPRLDALVEALFTPLLQDVSLVLTRVGDPRWAPRLAGPAAVLADAPGVHLLHAQAVFEWLEATGVLVKAEDGKTYNWGPEAPALAEHLPNIFRLFPIGERALVRAGH